MKIFDPKRHLPVGWDWENTQAKLFLWHGLSTMTLIGFLDGYIVVEWRDRYSKETAR